jgi:carbonic anhydrase
MCYTNHQAACADRCIDLKSRLASGAGLPLQPETVMCLRCEDSSNVNAMPRRAFVLGVGVAMAGLAMSCRGFAEAPKAAPKKENVLSPEAALKRLIEGNGRYVAGVARRHDFKNEREALVGGQNPFAGILSCADSRIAPEYAFDTGRGDLFVCRVAGNFLNTDVLASFEYAVAVLNTPLLMVLGHRACGAVDATIKSIRDGTTLPGHLPALVEAIGPAIKDAMGKPGDVLDAAIKANVLANVERLKAASPIISAAVADKKINVGGGVYNLADGRVALLS